MPQPKRTGRRLARLVLLFLATRAFLALGRSRPSEPAPVRYRPAEADTVPGWASTPAPPRRPARRRLAASLAFTVLFFAGASFSAVAGDSLVTMLEPEDQMALAEETTTEEETVAAEPEAAPVEEPAPVEEAAFVPDGAEAVPDADSGSEPLSPDPAPEPMEVPSVDPASGSEPQSVETAVVRRVERKQQAVAPKAKAMQPQPEEELDPEVHTPGTAATIWLNRPLGDPTPPSLRLSRDVAKRLVAAGRAHDVDWALVLGVLRANGVRRALPARSASIPETAARLVAAGARKDAWSAALALTGRTTQADRAVALARYYRAVGLRALVRGLAAEQERLAKRLLADPRVEIYAAGREDVEAGRIDVRVLALIAYLAESYDQVTVSSLFSGHRLFARPGVVSRHVYGQAVDVAVLGGVPIAGNQEPGSVTEKAVRDILLLPAEVLPRQVISLLGLGRPSFPLADHGDHIHVGY
jgi:hypothetical protein